MLECTIIINIDKKESNVIKRSQTISKEVINAFRPSIHSRGSTNYEKLRMYKVPKKAFPGSAAGSQ